MGKIEDSKDLLMVLLYARGPRGEIGEPICGKTRLTKLVFLFDKEVRRSFNLEKAVPDEAIPRFEAMHYGPFSAAVYSDLEFLVDMEFIRVDNREDLPSSDEPAEEFEYWEAVGADPEERGPIQPECFALTDLGIQFVEEELKDNFTDEQWSALNRFKAQTSSVSLASLLKYVYTKYPAYTTNSRIREQVMR